MAQQKIVVKINICMDECKKARKALKIAAGVCGVESAAFVGPNRDQIEVTGEGIDSVQLTRLLRKGVAWAVLVSLS